MLSEHGADRLIRERAVIILTEPRVEPIGDLADGNARPVACRESFRHDLQDLRRERLPPFVDEILLQLEKRLPYRFPRFGIIDETQKRQGGLVEPRFDLRNHDAWIDLDGISVSQSEMEKPVAQHGCFFLEAVREMDRNVATQASLPRLLGEKAALQCPIVERMPHADDLGAEDMKGLRVELLRTGDDRPENR